MTKSRLAKARSHKRFVVKRSSLLWVVIDLAKDKRVKRKAECLAQFVYRRDAIVFREAKKTGAVS